MVSRIIPQGVLITIVCFSSYTAAGETKQDAKTSLRFGAVQMQGTILEPVCTISTASREQAVALTDVSVPQLRDEGQGPADYFWIRLAECTVQPVKGGAADNLRFGSRLRGLNRTDVFS